MKSPRRRAWRLAGVPVVLLAAILAVGSIPLGPLRITPPPANAEPGRWVHLEGAANTRDLGGYATRDGRLVKRRMVYRSAKLNRLTSAGVATFRSLGVRVVLDFCNRLTPWPLFGGDVWGVQLAAAVRGCPMQFQKDEQRENFYIRGVRGNADSYRRAFEQLADGANYPLLYHCAAGTDRTGVMSALLLSLLGVDRETILADFRLSEQVDLPGSLPAMEALLDAVDAEGGVERYLAALGVSSAIQARIREILLETPTTQPAVRGVAMESSADGAGFVAVRLRYPDREEPFVVRTNYAFLIDWDEKPELRRFCIYDRPRGRVQRPAEFAVFLECLRALPAGVRVAWLDTCCAPLSWGMSDEERDRLEAAMAAGGKSLLGDDDDAEQPEFRTICTCESTGLLLPGE